MGRAFGIAASNDPDSIRRIASEVESLGYASLWTNDTPMADGLTVAAAAQEATTRLRLGVGVMPVDRRDIPEIAESLDGLDPARAIIGLGPGFSSRPVSDSIEAVEQMRAAAPEFRIALAAMGPRMCRTAGEVADAVLFNWMTPERVAWSIQKAKKAGAERPNGLPPLETITYVRAALGVNGRALIAEEAGRYASMPHYRRHFESMEADFESLGIALGDTDPSSLLSPFEDLLDETVVRALPQSPDNVDEILAIARAAAPAVEDS